MEGVQGESCVEREFVRGRAWERCWGWVDERVEVARGASGEVVRTVLTSGGSPFGPLERRADAGSR